MRYRKFILRVLAFLPVLALSIALSPVAAEAKVYIDLAAPANKRLPIAVQEFRHMDNAPAGSEEAKQVKEIAEELRNALISDLNFSDLFSIIPKEAYVEDADQSGLTYNETNFSSWRVIGADTLVKGGFRLDGDTLILEVRFFDCITEKQVLGKRYVGSVKNPRRVAHYFADKLYEELTGYPGIFTTRILFVSDRGGNKEVYMSDFDGANTSRVTRNRSINLSPQWAPDGARMLYISYKKGTPALYMLDLRTGRDTAVSERPGINIAGRFSPDGKRIALTLSGKKSPELHVMELDSFKDTQLTDNYAIDVSPTWSPDGKKLAFVSDISGNPHIFVIDLPTRNVKRLTFSGAYNSSPAWSPDGKLIAYARSDAGRFQIWVMRTDGSAPLQLTFEGDNRSPSWSPDGRYIIYSTTSRGKSSLRIMRSDGAGARTISTGAGNEKSPVWSPYL
ncbi:MAG: Tol-Pal system beta propeller repeat protein TolB, partial [Deltaproteobacteria bacterium]|nr:Tol-Pal system beta propeller repeat protein TolB [Deltaproteobacteria bacterium]